MAASTSLIYRDGAPSIDLGVQRGKVKGVSVVHKHTGQAKCYRYTGIPYALPPTGERRFKKPVALPDDFRYGADHRSYNDFGATCPQPSNFDFREGVETQTSLPSSTHIVSEDCLTLNIWIPAGPPPGPQGFPILFFVHGGWLQVGNPHHDFEQDPADFLANHEDGGKDIGAIVVAPGYRLNVFGFLATDAMSPGERGNFGFWDQRMALEWVVEHISAFQGDPNNITLGGLSAGAHSALSQALFEYMRLRNEPEQKPLFRHLFLQSNCAFLPAKQIDEVRSQVQQLLRALGIDADPASKEALDALRKVDAQTLVNTLPLLPLHTFRAVRGTGEFVDSAWSAAILDGNFAQWCKRHQIDFMLGEVTEEEEVYKLVNSPVATAEEDIGQALERQVNNYYPLETTKQLLQAYTLPSSSAEASEWQKVFGVITADSQVYASQRTFVDLMLRGGLGHESIFRYQIAHRAKYLDQYVPAHMGVSHSFDDALWWFARPFLLEPYLRSGQDSDRFEGEQVLDQLRHWLFSFRIFMVGGKERESLPRLWYGRRLKSSEARRGQVIRRLTPALQAVSVVDDRWESKLPVMKTIERILKEAATVQSAAELSIS